MLEQAARARGKCLLLGLIKCQGLGLGNYNDGFILDGEQRVTTYYITMSREGGE